MSSRRFVRYPYWSVCLLVVAAAVFDIAGFFVRGPGLRYALVSAPFVLVLLGGGSIALRRSLRGPDLILFLLFLYGAVGAATDRLVIGSPSGALAVFIPMSLAFLHVVFPFSTSEALAYRTLKHLSLLTAAYVLLHVITNRAFTAAPVRHVSYDHEKAFLIAVAVVAAILLRRRLLAVVLLVSTVVIFRAYPAATYLVVAVTAASTLFLTTLRNYRRAFHVAVVAFGVVTIGAIARFDQGTGWVATYLEHVGKANTTVTRYDLWQQAVRVFGDSPLIGNGFTGDISIPVNLSGHILSVPPHNDWLQLAMSGGLLGLVPWVIWIGLANRVVLAGIRTARVSGLPAHEWLLRTLLVGFNAFHCTSLFNPIITQVGLSATMYVLYSMMMAVCIGLRRRSSVPSPAHSLQRGPGSRLPVHRPETSHA